NAVREVLGAKYDMGLFAAPYGRIGVAADDPADTYSDDRLLELTADSTKPEIANIVSALNKAAPDFSGPRIWTAWAPSVPASR
ncbi:hypothetical protein, partial [Pseudomonas viridiflava]|uniref:hypothetical protein n=1 Tax=Pseudomonas viridiflava TaxID=33069 RepID=UPI0013C2F2C5